MKLVIVTVMMLSRACALFTAKHGRRVVARAPPLFISKTEYRSKSIEELKEMNAGLPPDPKKEALLQKLQLDGADTAVKTGAELRRQRKQEMKVKGAKPSASKSKPPKSTSSYAAAQEKPVRFNLGSGIEVLTARNLLDLVASTAPYLFPESGPRVVIEEDDFFEDLEGYTSSASADPSPAAADGVVADTRSAVEKSQGASGWLTILKSSHLIPNTNTPTEDQRVDYFALCMASHFATVATFVPTDVDSKIRGHCWDDPSPAVLNAQFEVLKAAMAWDVTAVSKRTVKVVYRPPARLDTMHSLT
jgi:hypothetical protein